MTKFDGTDRQTVEVSPIDLADPKPVEIPLDGGSRTELATVPTRTDRWRLDTRPGAAEPATSGLAAGPARRPAC